MRHLLFLMAILLIFVGCNGLLPYIENPQIENLIFDRDTLFAHGDGNKLLLEFQMDNQAAISKEAALTFTLRSIIDNSVHGSVREKIDVKVGKHKYQLVMPLQGTLLEDLTNKADYVYYNVEFTLEEEENKYSGIKSLLDAVQKYNLQVIGSDNWEATRKVPIRVIIPEVGMYQEKALVINVTLATQAENPEQVFAKSYELDNEGELIIKLNSPAREGVYTLNIEASDQDSIVIESVDFDITVSKNRKIYITTDKPIYQPGQDIHIRALALGDAKKPAAREQANITVLDGKGNKVFKKDMQTNDYGLVYTTFALASFVNLGHYKIEVTIGDTKSEKTINVEKYVLPKFKANLDTDKDYYRPGDNVNATINGTYFFGKPVSQAEVDINLYAFDLEWQLFNTLSGFTDRQGNYDFNFEIPSYLVGSQLEQGLAGVRIAVALKDNAEHTETIERILNVTESGIVAHLLPESARFGNGMDIKFYLITTDPLGRPLQTENHLTIGTESLILATTREGYASFSVAVEQLPLVVGLYSTTEGQVLEKKFTFGSTDSAQENYILLRIDKPRYKVGESIMFNIFTSINAKKIYVDLIKEDKTMLTSTVPMEQKKARGTLDISADMDGILRLSAYTVLNDSTIIRDTRLIYVDRADELDVSIKPEKEELLPGQMAKLNIQVKDSTGRGLQSAVGFVVVDEAVYALQENKPGLERVYFEVEEAIKVPRYEIHGFSFSEVFYQEEEADPTKAEILLTAYNNPYATGIEYSSKAVDLEQVKSQVFDLFSERCFYPLLKELSNWIFNYDGNLKNTERPLLEQLEDLITHEQIGGYDLWQQRIIIRLSGEQLQIISKGWDQVLGTKDDLMIGFYYNDLYYEYEWYRDIYEPPLVLFDLDDFILEQAIPAAEGGVKKDALEDITTTQATGETEGIKVRNYFPETLYVEPALITDIRGRGSVSFPVADSITTWRISSTANTKAGQLGSSLSSLRVFQDFFVDIDFPVSLTQNDEISVPIAMYNYLKQVQRVELNIRQESWFELLDNPVKSRILESNQVAVEYFKIRVKEIGHHTFRITARGEKLSDAIERRIQVIPDGEQVTFSYSDRLEKGVSKDIIIPVESIEKSQQVLVKLYPGLFSQVVEGLDSLFRLPGGCFEQTSSTTYPNILTLKYMQDTGTISPEIELKATSYINQGYQRLLTFECAGGGFEWFGNEPAHNILTAYGLMEFYDMSFVHTIDNQIIKRTQDYLKSRQSTDGSFPPDEGGIAEGAINAFQGNILRNTGYIAWALAYSQDRSAALDQALGYIKQNTNLDLDSYTLAILANALLAKDPADPLAAKILSNLSNRKKIEGNGCYWEQDLNTSMYGAGDVAVIETTALVAYAFLQGNAYFADVNGAINYLIRQKDSFGNWSSTQATITSLRTFIKSLGSSTKISEGIISIKVNNRKVKDISINKDNYDVLNMVDISPFIKKGKNKVELNVSAQEDVPFLYQIAGTYYLPREQENKTQPEPVSIKMGYDRTTLAVDDMIKISVSVKNNYHNIDLAMMIVDLGIPPGFDVITDDFNPYLDGSKLTRVEPTGRQLILYISGIKARETLNFAYRIKARFPMKVASPSCRLYAYYGEEEALVTPPKIEVR